MYDVNDLVAALQSGKTVDQIAAEMSATLNAAKVEADRLAAEKAAEEKRVAAACRKRELMANFYMALGNYLLEFHPDSVIAEMIEDNGVPSNEDLDQLAEQVDSLVETFEAMKGLSSLFAQNPAFAPFGVPVSKAQSNDNEMFKVKIGNLDDLIKEVEKNAAIDPIEEFLNKNVRK